MNKSTPECAAVPKNILSAEGSELLMELFNRMPVEALKRVPHEIAKRIGDFMVANGYRIVFDRWCLQAEPKGPETSVCSSDELAQLRCIDRAARRYVDGRTEASYFELCDELFNASPRDPRETTKPTSASLAAQIEAAKKRVAEWPADVRVALGLPDKPTSAPDECTSCSKERGLLKETSELLLAMREDIFQRGSLSGRNQRSGDDLLRKIGTLLTTRVEKPCDALPSSKKQLVWQPISEYNADCYTVVVWLEWSAYSELSKKLEYDGTWVAAFRMPLNDGSVWVNANTRIPVETLGRKITHLLCPVTPR